MSIYVSSLVWKHCPQESDRLLLMLALADFCNDEAECWPSQQSLAQRIRCTERGVQKMIDQLAIEGEIEIIRQGGGRGRSAKYFLERYHPEKGERGAIQKGEPGDTKGERERRKGERGDNKGRTSCSPEPSVEPSIEPSHEPSGSGDRLTGGDEEDEIPEVQTIGPTAGDRFADWFRTILPPTQKLEPKWRENWARLYDQLVRIDKREHDQIVAVCKFARNDSFWSANFLSPVKLRNKNKDGVTYYDVFLARSKSNRDAQHKKTNSTSLREKIRVPVSDGKGGVTYITTGGDE